MTSTPRASCFSEIAGEVAPLEEAATLPRMGREVHTADIPPALVVTTRKYLQAS